MTYWINKIPKISEEWFNKFLYTIKNIHFKDRLLKGISNWPIVYLTDTLEAICLNNYTLSDDDHTAISELSSLIRKKYYEYPHYSAIRFYIEAVSPSIDSDQLSKSAQLFHRLDKKRYNSFWWFFDTILQKNSKEIDQHSNSYANNNHKVFTPVEKLPEKKESRYYTFDWARHERPKRRRKRI